LPVKVGGVVLLQAVAVERQWYLLLIKGLLEVDFGRREEDPMEAKRVPVRVPDTRLITPYRS